MISDTQTDIRRPKTEKRQVDKPSSTGKLDILQNQDQYGLNNLKTELPDDPARAHDYDWFIDEMKNDVTAPPSSSGPHEKIESELKFEEPSDMVDPITPVESSPPPSSDKSEGVDKFIDEFKREVEKFRSDESESVSIEAASVGQSKKENESSWEETFEKVTPQQVELFTQQLAQDIGERIARIIINKIDSEKLMILIKDEIVKASYRGNDSDPKKP